MTRPDPETSSIFEQAFIRIDAIAQAKEALGIEDRFRNYYNCDSCDTEWTDEWSCGCDDECPSCGLSMSPYDSVNLDDEEADDDA